jgi:hypothetical protein
MFKMTVVEVRMLTKWRHLGFASKSALDITEVQRLNMELCSTEPNPPSGEKKTICARPWTPQVADQVRTQGEVPLWYEVSVVSTEAETIFEENKSLKLGEITQWTVETLRERNVLNGIYEPALHMIKQMDRVGGNEYDSSRYPPNGDIAIWTTWSKSGLARSSLANDTCALAALPGLSVATYSLQ